MARVSYKNRLCACGHVWRIHGRAWIPDDHCRGWNTSTGECNCDEFKEAAA